MCCPVLGRRLHGVCVYGLHGNGPIAEVVEVMHRGLVVRVIVTGVGPCRMLVLIRVLVMVVVVLVVHLQLAHEVWWREVGSYNVARAAASLLDDVKSGSDCKHLRLVVGGGFAGGGAGDLRAAACMHAWAEDDDAGDGERGRAGKALRQTGRPESKKQRDATVRRGGGLEQDWRPGLGRLQGKMRIRRLAART